MLSQMFLLIFLCTPLAARLFVVSDIDDTIKQSNSASLTGQIYHFYRMKSYPVMANLYQDIATTSKDVTFYYVSAAFDFLYKQERWLDRYGFPYGETFLRERLSEKSYQHKYETVAQLLAQVNEQDEVYFFGDNSSFDPQVYLAVIKNFNIVNSHIFIRDVMMTAHDTGAGLAVERLEGVHYFVSEYDLIKILPFTISAKTKSLLVELFTHKTLIPKYTHKTLFRLLSKKKRCYHALVYQSTMNSLNCPAARDYFTAYYHQGV